MSQGGRLEDLLMAALMRSSSASPSTCLDSRGFHSSLTVPQGCKVVLLLLDRHAARHHMQVLQYSPHHHHHHHHHLQSSSSPPEGHLCHNNDLLNSDIKATMFQEWHKEDLPVAVLRTFATPFKTRCASYTAFPVLCPGWLLAPIHSVPINHPSLCPSPQSTDICKPVPWTQQVHVICPHAKGTVI